MSSQNNYSMINEPYFLYLDTAQASDMPTTFYSRLKLVAEDTHEIAVVPFAAAEHIYMQQQRQIELLTVMLLNQNR